MTLPRPCTTLSVEVDRGHAETDEAREERLFHVGELLECHVLDDRRQLVVVSDHDAALQTTEVVLRILRHTHTTVLLALGSTTHKLLYYWLCDTQTTVLLALHYMLNCERGI